MNKCSIEGCEKPVQHRGLCTTHYKRWWRHGDPTKSLSKKLDLIKCKVNGCNRLISSASGYCNVHYNRVRRHGTPDKLRRDFGTGGLDSAGYMWITVDGKRVYRAYSFGRKSSRT